MTLVRQLPNLITVLRLTLVPPMAWLLAEGRFLEALWIFLLMGFSDGLDGLLAKRFGWRTALGGYLDPVADKVMLMTAYLTLGALGLLPWWLVAAVILRDLVIIGGAAAYYLLVHRLEMAPTYLSKLNTVTQIALVLVVIVAQVIGLPRWALPTLVMLTLFTTLASGLDYVVVWSRRARMDARHDSR
jgi:cardiolipin synthase